MEWHGKSEVKGGREGGTEGRGGGEAETEGGEEDHCEEERAVTRCRHIIYAFLCLRA